MDNTVDDVIKLIEANKVEQVEQILQDTPDNGKSLCSTVGKKGFTLLESAVFCSHIDLVSLLLTKEVDVNHRLETTVRKGVDWYEQGSTALHIACSKRHNDIVLALLKAKANVNAVNEGAAHQTPLHVAAENGHLAHVQCLVEAGADVHSVDQGGDQPIHKATKNGHNPVVIFLVTNGCQINNANNEGYTPLMLAVSGGQLKTTILLLENNADITSLDSDKNNPLSLTILKGQEDIIPLLLDNEVDTNAQNVDGNTPLHLACQLNQPNTVSLLLEVGVEINLQNQVGRTALHMAALSNSYDIITQLVTSGVERERPDLEGKVASECTTNPEIATIISTGVIPPAAPNRELTIVKSNNLSPHQHSSHNNSTELEDVQQQQQFNNVQLQQHPYGDLAMSSSMTLAEPTSEEPRPEYIEATEADIFSPRAPLSPRIERQSKTPNSHEPHRQSKAKTKLIPHNSETHMLQKTPQPLNPTRAMPNQFQQPIGVDKATVEILKQKVKGLESQILTLGLGDDKAVVLYRQYGKLNEEMNLAKLMVRDYLMQNARPLTPRMENNQSKANCPSPMDLPIPRHGASTPRETKTTFNNSRKFNPNFMVETVESLKSELQILRNKVKQTHLSKLNQYIVQVESVALAIITFAHVMAVTLML